MKIPILQCRKCLKSYKYGYAACECEPEDPFLFFIDTDNCYVRDTLSFSEGELIAVKKVCDLKAVN